MPAKPKAAKKKRQYGPKPVVPAASNDLIAAAADLIPREVYDYHSKMIRNTNGNPNNKSFSPKILQSILLNIMRGHPAETAAKNTAVLPKTYYEWCNNIPGFRDSVHRAEAIREGNLSEIAMAGAAEDPRIAISILERLHPSTWAPKRSMEGTINHRHTGLGAEFAHKISGNRGAIDIIDAEVVESESTQKQLNGNGLEQGND